MAKRLTKEDLYDEIYAMLEKHGVVFTDDVNSDDEDHVSHMMTVVRTSAEAIIKAVDKAYAKGWGQPDWAHR